LIMVFWSKSPLIMQQIFLTLMSSLMAFSLTGLAEWTTWILLGLLAIWDLIAVLCPFGPLKILIESSKKQGQEVPALLYTVNAVWLMAFDATQLSRSSAEANGAYNADNTDNANQNEGATQVEVHAVELTAPSQFAQRERTPSPDNASNNRNSTITTRSSAYRDSSDHRSDRVVSGGSLQAPLSPRQYLISDEEEAARRSSSVSRQYLRSSAGEGSNDTSGRPSSAAAQVLGSVDSNGRHQRQNSEYELSDHPPDGLAAANGNQGDEEEEDERSGLKLGLGDFVFYSVLIARASLFDWVTTVACTVAVMMGLNATIFLLAIKRRALPALPISIAFGLVFYFVGSIMLTPLLERLAVLSIFV